MDGKNASTNHKNVTNLEIIEYKNLMEKHRSSGKGNYWFYKKV